jgi:hypothetical protein
MVTRKTLVAFVAAVCALACVVVIGTATASPTPNLSCNSGGSVVSGGVYDQVDVPVGAVCRMDAVSMNTLTVEGQLLQGSDLVIAGNVTAKRFQAISIDDSDILGNVSIITAKNTPANQDPVDIEINHIHQSLVVKYAGGGTGDLLVSTNTVDGNEKDISSKVKGDFSISAETVGLDMLVKGLNGKGTKEVDGNTVGGMLTCKGNKSPFESHGNTAGSKVGQCN